jgi:hypothetical protein
MHGASASLAGKTGGVGGTDAIAFLLNGVLAEQQIPVNRSE